MPHTMIRARTPEGLKDLDRPIEDCMPSCLPDSHALLQAASQSLFYSLPVAFDPAQASGCHLATVDRDANGEPWRFIDMGAQIATCPFGENDPATTEAIRANLPAVVNRYSHSEYQTVLSLRFKAALSRIAPEGASRHFVVNTGAESVENAIKAALLVRARTSGMREGGVIVSFEGGFHGRTLGALAVTHRRKARLGFPTFDWPQAIFPTDDPRSPAATLRREERSLRQVWQAMHGAGRQEGFGGQLARIDSFLECEGDLSRFVYEERDLAGAETLRRAQRVAAVIIEPVQGEGGIHMATARFHRRLRLLTLIYGVPMIYDEAQTGFGATGRMWAHEHFDLPAPPEIVTWAKKAQNGVVFVDEALAAFFQEERKFNTTWEGDPVGMLRVMAWMDRLDLGQVRRTGAIARSALEAFQARYPELIQRVRGLGVMLAFDVIRADWRDILRDRAFRRGLILLPAGERALRFYPRYDTPESTIDEAIGILGAAMEDLHTHGAAAALGPRIRMGTITAPENAVEFLGLDSHNFPKHSAGIMSVEIERYGTLSRYPEGVMQSGRRPLLQFPVEALAHALGNPRSIGLVLKFSGRVIGYAVGGPLEDHDEEGVADDPHFGDQETFYLLAMAVDPSVANASALEHLLLDHVRDRAIHAGYRYFSTLMEERFHADGSAWLQGATVVRTLDNYLRSGLRFVYLSAALAPASAP